MPASRTNNLLAAALLPLILTACGSGIDPQTYQGRSTQDASNAGVGDLALRNVAILPPEPGLRELAIGKDAFATLAVVSVSHEKDTLVSVSTPAATSVELVDASGHAVPTVEVPALRSVDASDFAIVLRGLTKALRPGMYVEMTFAFEKNGRASFKVPVKVYAEPVPRESFAPKEKAE